MKAFCDYCYCLVNYTVKATEVNKNIKGQKYSFIGKNATCNICNHSVAIESISDYNLKLLDNLYRKENKLISIEDIQSILDKYNIGKLTLSLSLGWDEHTIDRYLKGDIPNKKYSDILKSILDNPDILKEHSRP